MNYIFQFRWLLVAVAIFGLAACASRPLTGPVTGPATYDLDMDYTTGGFQRSYRVHIPRGYNGEQSLPLVVVIHGAFDTAVGMERFAGFSRLADQENFIVLYPNGIGILGYLQHWNAGHCCGKAAADNIDDVGYLEAAIENVARRLAAAAPLAASIGGRPANDAPEWRIPDPVKPLPLFMMHGRSDDDIPFNGGHSKHRGGERTYWSVDESVRFWAKHNGCTGSPAETSHIRGAVSIRTREPCRDQSIVTLYTIEKWGHVWPGPYFTADLPVDDPLYNFDAAEIIWNFFKQFNNTHYPSE